MTITALPAPARPGTDLDDGLCHVVCCMDVNQSFCGLDMAEALQGSDNDLHCAVCMDVAGRGCPNGFVCPEDLP